MPIELPQDVGAGLSDLARAVGRSLAREPLDLVVVGSQVRWNGAPARGVTVTADGDRLRICAQDPEVCREYLVDPIPEDDELALLGECIAAAALSAAAREGGAPPESLQQTRAAALRGRSPEG